MYENHLFTLAVLLALYINELLFLRCIEITCS